MLCRLTIKSFALIDDIDLEFGAGMTVLLGETGAGKSIIIDALSVALGSRTSSDMVRSGARKAIVEAEFDVSSDSKVSDILREFELDELEGNRVLVRREIPVTGASRAFVNDTPASVGAVRSLASVLIDFHGQHDTHGLLSSQNHRIILDTFAGTGPVVSNMKALWQEHVAAIRKRDEVADSIRHADAALQRLKFVLQEIEAVNPSEGEDEAIAQELQRFEAREHIITHASVARDALYAGSPSAYDLLRTAADHIRPLTGFDSSLLAVLEDVESAIITTKEAANTVSRLTDEEEFSSARLEELRLRHLALNGLAKRYGSLQAALEAAQQARSEVELYSNADAALAAADAAVTQTRAAALEVATDLRARRNKAASKLATLITDSTAEMGMPLAQFATNITTVELGPTGIDGVEFLFSANSGIAPDSLGKVASGGELSRVMLGIKTALSNTSGAGTMVFDEIDTGISGKVARTVGEVMKRLSSTQQIICITHLAQIAGLADAYVRVEKSQTEDKTQVTAVAVTTDEALLDVAKLISGSDVTDTAMKGARELMSGIAKDQ